MRHRRQGGTRTGRLLLGGALSRVLGLGPGTIGIFVLNDYVRLNSKHSAAKFFNNFTKKTTK